MIWSIDFDSGSGSGDEPDQDLGSDTADSTSGGGDNRGSGSGGNSGSGSFGAGSGSGLVYVDPSIWSDPQPLVACEPPCVLVLPPIQLTSPTVINFPPLTMTYVINPFATDSAGGQGSPTLVTVTTAIAIPPITTTEIQMWAITVFTNDSTAAKFTAVQSVRPPPITATLSGPPLFPQSTPLPGDQDTSTSKSAAESHLITIYPQPTNSINYSSEHPISYTSSQPKPSCTAHCGTHDCAVFGCGGDCGLFGCGGNCGLLGCGGGCGIVACGGPCGIGGCGGCGLGGCGQACPLCAPNIDIPKPDSSGGDEGSDDGKEEEDGTDEDEDEDEIEACILEEADLSDGPTPADGIISIQEIHPSVVTVTPPPGTTTVTPIPPSTVISPTVTITVIPTPSPQAICNISADALWYNVKIRSIKGAWASDGGGGLHDEVSGCGTVTKWSWHDDKGGGTGASVTFRLPPIVKDGRVRRAIRSAGGPEVDC